MDSLYFVTALVGGTVLAFQLVMMLLGLGHHHGDLSGLHGGDIAGHGHFGGGHLGHTDVSGHDGTLHHSIDGQVGHSHVAWFYELLSIRTLSAAATFFGLTGKTTLAYGLTPLRSFVLASLAGLAAMYAVYWLFKQVYKLQHTGTENIRNAVGAGAVVYVPIPGKRAGAGKVTFRLQNRLVEYLAVTDEEGRLATGEKVIVNEIVNSDTVRVSRESSPATSAGPSPNTVASAGQVTQ
jgi:hypothetical protein